jgi:ribosomal protein S12 methylthiotransferase accessory factor
VVQGSVVTAAAQDRFTPLHEALERLEAAVSPLVGIVTQTMRTMHAPDEACIPNSACELASAARTLGAPTVDYGSGAHPDEAGARAAAIGEALERYCGMFLPHSRLRAATARELGTSAVDPARFALFRADQLAEPGFPFAAFTDTTRTVFVEGESLVDGSPVFVPAELVFLGRVAPTLRSIAYSTTSGLACGATRDEARLAALLELVERDAVMLAWNGKLSLPLFDWADDIASVRLERKYFLPTGLRYSVLDGSRFLGVPVAISVLHGPRGSRAALALGAGCAPTARSAWLKALSESFGVYRWLCMEVAGAPDRPLPEPGDVKTFDQHMLYYADEDRARLARFLDASTTRTSLAGVPPLEGSTPREQIEAVVRRLESHGVSAYAVDVTSPDVASLGLHVSRVITPELCALDVWHAARFLGGPRLYSAAQEAGFLPAPLDPADVNPHPHPFP